MIQVISILGALTALLAYVMVSYRSFNPTGTAYNTVNLVSCIVLGSVAVLTNTWGYILLNVVWGFLATKHLYTNWKVGNS